MANIQMGPDERFMLIHFGFAGSCNDMSKLRREMALFRGARKAKLYY